MLWKEAFVNGLSAPMKIIGFLFILFVVIGIMSDIIDLLKKKSKFILFGSQ